MNAIRRFLLFLALGSCAFVLSKAFFDFFLVPGEPPEGNPISRTILAVCYSGVAMSLIFYYREALFVVRRNWPLAALLLLAAISSLWSDLPGLVLQRTVAVLGTTLLGIALAVRLSLEEQLQLMRWVFRIMAVLSLIFVLMLPNMGISTVANNLGEWKGIFGYKNVLGSMMAMSILVEWHVPADTGFSKLIKWLALLISAILLVFSRSITPLVVLVASLLFVEAYKFVTLRLRLPLYAIVAAIVLMMASGVLVFAMETETLTYALGRSSNLSGRTEIWNFVLSDIAERPVFGYGYSAFWSGVAPESVEVDQAIGMTTMYSHNGYLEVLLNVGAVGLLLVCIFLSKGVKRAYFCSWLDPSPAHVWPLAFLSFFLLYNIAECTILLQDLQWALCVAVVISSDNVLTPDEEQEEGEELLFTPVDQTT